MKINCDFEVDADPDFFINFKGYSIKNVREDDEQNFWILINEDIQELRQWGNQVCIVKEWSVKDRNPLWTLVKRWIDEGKIIKTGSYEEIMSRLYPKKEESEPAFKITHYKI